MTLLFYLYCANPSVGQSARNATGKKGKRADVTAVSDEEEAEEEVSVPPKKKACRTAQ